MTGYKLRSRAAEFAQRLVLGTLHLRGLTRREISAVLDAFFTQGGRWLDVATLYGGLPLLKCIGEYLRTTGVDAQVFVKVGYFADTDEYYDQQRLASQIDLAVDAIGSCTKAVLLHEADWQVWWRPKVAPYTLCTAEDVSLIAERLQRLQEQAKGWKLPLGLSGNHAEVLRFVCMQSKLPISLMVAKQYDLLWRNALPLVQLAQERGFPLILGAPWHQGWLRNMDRLIRHRPECLSMVSQLRELTQKNSITVESLALPFIAQSVPSAKLAFGASSPFEVRQAFADFVRPLADDLINSIRALGRCMPPMGPLITF